MFFLSHQKEPKKTGANRPLNIRPASIKDTGQMFYRRMHFIFDTSDNSRNAVIRNPIHRVV